MPPKKRTTTEKVNALATGAKAAKERALADKRRKCDELVDLIRRRQARIVEDFYDIGEALRTILRDKLYEAHGAKSFAAFLDTEALIPRATAMRLIAIVDHVPRREALKLGQEKSYALVAYTEATPAADTAATLARTDAKIARRPISKSSVRDLRQAATAARKKGTANRPATQAERERAKRDREAERTTRAFLLQQGITRPKLTATPTGIRLDLTHADIAKLEP
jgi:hypothetical protein